MRSKLTALLVAGGLAASACTPVGTLDSNQVAGGLLGAGVGALTASALTNDPAWTVVGALGGAAAGTLIARNANNNMCAYARGDGTYYRAPCP